MTTRKKCVGKLRTGYAELSPTKESMAGISIGYAISHKMCASLLNKRFLVRINTGYANSHSCADLSLIKDLGYKDYSTTKKFLDQTKSY